MTGDGARNRLNEIIEKSENYSWVYFVIVLVFLGSIRFEIISASENVIDAILIVTTIALSSHAIGKIKNRNHSKKPYLQCLNCGQHIGPVGEWACKKCGWKSTFPDT